MSIFAYLNGVLVATSNIRLRSNGDQGYEGLPAAADGTGAQGALVFDDSAGTLTVQGWEIVKVVEADCTSAPVLFYGTVADHTEKRGPYRQGASRQIDTTINDHNVFLSLHTLKGNTWSRPEETDTARLAALLADDALDGLVYDLGLVNGAGRTFEATNYIGQYPADVLTDLCGPRGQIFFTYWDQAAQKVGLFFDSPAATIFTCTLSISNVESDINRDANGEPTGTVYPPYYDGELVGDPVDVYSTVRYKYKGSSLYRTNGTTQSTFFPAPLNGRDLAVENDRVGKRTTAITFADRILEADSEERATLRFTVRLPSTKVGLIQAGMRIQCRFSHLTGFTSATYTRIERLTTVPVDGDPTHYDVTLECSTAGFPNGGGLGPGTGGGSTSPFPPVSQGATHYAAGTFNFFSEGAGSSGGPAVAVPIASNTTSSVTGDSQVVLASLQDYTYHFAFTLNAADLGTGHEVGLVNITNPAVWGSPHLSAGGGDTTILYEGTFTAGAAATAYVSASAAGASHIAKAAAIEWYIDPVGWDSGSTPEDPAPGSHVEDEVPTPPPGGGNKTFLTAYPFAEESLLVFVDGVDETSAVTSMSGSAKTFTLGFDPRSYEVVTVHYLTA